MTERRTLLIFATLVLPSLAPPKVARGGYRKTPLVKQIEALNPIRIEVMRKYSGPVCNSGYISVDGRVVAYTLERPSSDNQPLFSAVPAGTYSAHLRYDHDDHWRFELEDVPGRSAVQIHVGNTIDDTIGCVLIGKGLGQDYCSLSQSRAAYESFKEAVYGAADDGAIPPEVEAIVTISDPA